MEEITEVVCSIRRADPRFAAEAYYFIFESLAFAHNELGLGRPRPRPEDEQDEEVESDAQEPGAPVRGERHLSGQELCEAIRLCALDQFGYMAECVFRSWGVHSTSDFGDIVYHLVETRQLHKTDGDSRDDFDDVFDFSQGLRDSFRITTPGN